jgi:hypothetical protein
MRPSKDMSMDMIRPEVVFEELKRLCIRRGIGERDEPKG